ncbi:MAG: glycosyltransferase [Bacteroidaceae bacterium]
MNRKILFLHGEFPCGGAERVTIDIANYVVLHGYDVYVLARKVNNKECPNITIIELPDSKDTNSLINANFIISTLNALPIDIFILPIQILNHLNYIKSNIHCKLIFALHSLPLWEVIFNLYQKKKRNKSSFLKSLEWRLLTYPKTIWLKKYDKPFIEKHQQAYEQADIYTVLCDEYKQILINKLGLPQGDNKVRVIYNSERTIEHINRNKKKQILFVGRMEYEDKRVDRLIDIWGMIYKKAPDWELLLVGDGEERNALEAQAQKMQLQRIHFVGYSNNPQIYYRDASILCLTSNFEGWPLCLTEAQANGVVPIAFDCTAGVHEILSPSGVNGLLVPPFKLKKYAHTLLALLNSPEKLKEMQGNVILKSKNYSPEIVGKKWLALFESLKN